MGDIHRLVVQHGRERAREMVPTKQRHLVDVAAEVLADEAQNLGITYSGFCLTGFPHKRLPDGEVWEKRGHNVTLLVEPGRLKTGPGPTVLFGVPYGARARMILIYLQTQAVRTGSREVHLGRSMRNWMGRMGMAVGGETARALRDQARRISACSIKFFWTVTDEAGRASDGFERGAIVRNGLFFRDDGEQGNLFEDIVTLDETFYKALSDHPVPLLESAIRQLKERSMALDIYIWLAYRLHALAQPAPISWTSLHTQFGTGFKLVRQFKPHFLDALAAATAAYPDARVNVTETSVTLHPSRPPVARIG
ncbi:pirin [Siccirubricoccus sp. G192]|nr:pirin [Siccirubricoccus sp. G192]MBV1800672.1 pirin [Siccirubricoccus sp. G192]